MVWFSSGDEVGETVFDLTRRARFAGLSGNFSLGHEILDGAAKQAGEDAWARASVAIERGRLFNSAGLPAEAAPFFAEAFELAQRVGDHNLAVDAVHMLAIASDVEAAEQWVAVALDYIEAHGASPQWRGMLHHNLGWTYFEAGRFEDALGAFRRDEAIREASGNAQTLKVTRYAVVRTLRALSRVDEAIALGEKVVALADAANDAAPYVYEELTECYAMKGEMDDAQRFATRAHAILSENASFVMDEPVRLARLAELAAGAAAAG
jgi:tetratricopeptide (TPR) repeat protein